MPARVGASAPWLRLRVLDLAGEARERLVGAEGLTIGGAPCDLVLADPGAAALRVVVARDGDAWTVDDPASSGAVFVDHRPLIGAHRLARGDKIYVGTDRIDVVDLAEPDGERARIPGGAAHRAPTAPIPRASGRRPIIVALALTLVAAAALAFALSSADADDGPSNRAAGPDEPVSSAMSQETGSWGQVDPAPARRPAPASVEVEHEVIAGETVDSIAARYHASRWRIADDNRLSPDRPLTPGQRLRIDAVDPPLPRARLRARVGEGDTWAALSARYGLGKAEIQGQNPGLGDTLSAGASLELWVEPQIQRRRAVTDDVDFPVLALGVSIGSPSAGRLDGGVEMPESPLYIRRNPRIMFGSAHAVAALQRAIHRFRRAYAYEGVLVVADLSRPGGGPLPPHLSHQAGRDVDIWMPTLRGAYDPSYLAEDRRPSPDEVNWPATWGLIDALLGTGAVQYIFLSKSIQDRLYRAAAQMGATPGELARIQWQPEGVDDRSPAVVAPIRDAPGHTGHIHVRFTCGPGEGECLAHAARVEEP